MLKIGLTGGIGSGKTLVGEVFAALKVPVYVADQEARRLMETSPVLRNSLDKLFGSKAFKGDNLDRRYIGEIVFNDKRMLTSLNKIVHPAVHADFERWAEQYRDLPYVMEEAAVLFESGGAKRMDKTFFVKAAEQTRIRRVMARDNVSGEQVLARIRNQWSDEKKEKLADFIIYNENDSMILPQIVDLHQDIIKLNS